MAVFNADVVKGKWTEIKGLLQQKYGHTKEDFDSQLTGIYNKFLDKKDRIAEDVKKNIKQ